MFSTAIPACEAAASMAAIGAVEKNGYRLRRLWQNREMLAGGLRETGCDTGASETPIIPVMVRDVRTALELSSFLMEEGIYAPAIRPPTVRQPRLRITVSASHQERHIKRMVRAMRRFGPGLHRGA
jgi:7-keto-8-aminopelargonate synthetase-like enzyme